MASVESARVLTVDLPPEPSSATRAREVARQQLTGSYSADVLDAAVLVVTELVTNAILHARTRLRLTIEARPATVRIVVKDSTPSVLPQRMHLEPDAVTGRGLALVEHLSTSWGVDVTGSGKVVWSEIAT